MATENRGVMVYLPPEIEEYIASFCNEHGITRKDKEGNVLPSLGTGVVTYLKSKILGDSPDDILTKPSKSLGIGLTKDEVLDLIQEYITSQSPSNGLTKDEVIDLIEQSVTNSHSPQLIGASDIEVALEPIKESVTELEAYARSQFAAVREEVKKALGNRIEPDTIAIPTPPPAAKTAGKPKPDDEPDWVTNETRPFYNRLKDDHNLLGKVEIAIAQHPDKNVDLAAALLPIGFHKADGTPLSADKMPRIKKVVKHMNIPSDNSNP